MVWAVSLSTMGLIPHRLTPGLWSHGIGGLVGFGKLMQPPSPSRALPPWRNTRGCTSMHFGENQLSPGSIGISPLSTAHPRILPHPQVRASTGLYSRFTLAMGKSPGFRSISLPSRGAFHLSLTVLVHYRSPRVFSLGGWSPQLPTRFLVSRGTWEQDRSRFLFVYGTLTLYGSPFQGPSTKKTVAHSVPRRQSRLYCPTTRPVHR